MAKTRKRQPAAESSENVPTATMERPRAANGDDRRGRIAERAYALYLARGGTHGSDWEDWLIAEREVLGRSDESGE